MDRLKVLTIVGTRPEIIRLSRVIDKLDTFCDHKIVHTGQNYDYELSEIFFKDLGLRRPDYFLDVASSTPAKAIARIISSVDEVLDAEAPDAILILGDTNSCLSAIAAKRRKIPIFHMEAGNRCFDMRVPEEINRRIVDHISDINLTYSTIARECLLNEGLSPDLVIKVGSPMAEVLGYYSEKIKASEILSQLGLEVGKYFVVSSHREENIDSSANFNRLVDVVNGLAERYSLPIIFSTHPRTKKRIEGLGSSFNPLVKLLPPMSFTDYVCLQSNSRAVLSDSGTITEESSILNFPALNLRETQERHEGMEQAAVMMVGLNQSRIYQCIDILNYEAQLSNRVSNPVNDYKDINVSDKILKIIHSHVDYVNRVVWKKY